MYMRSTIARGGSSFPRLSSQPSTRNKVLEGADGVRSGSAGFDISQKEFGPKGDHLVDPRDASVQTGELAYDSWGRPRYDSSYATTHDRYMMGNSALCRYGPLISDQCTIYRPSEGHLEGWDHMFRPYSKPGITNCCNSQGGSVQRLRSVSSKPPLQDMHTVCVKDMLRYRSQLKGQSPSALAIEADRVKHKEQREKERLERTEFRQRWRESVEGQLNEKRRQRELEKERERQRREAIEDAAADERLFNLDRKRRTAAEINRQRVKDEQMLSLRRGERKALEAEEKRRLDEEVRHGRELERDRAELARSQHEAHREALLIQARELREKAEAEAAREREEGQRLRRLDDQAIAEEAAKKSEIRRRNKEFLSRGTALNSLKEQNDQRMQTEYEAAEAARRNEERKQELKELQEAQEQRNKLAVMLKSQMLEAQRLKSEERARLIETQRKLIERQSLIDKEKTLAEERFRDINKNKFREDLVNQMHYNLHRKFEEWALE